MKSSRACVICAAVTPKKYQAYTCKKCRFCYCLCCVYGETPVDTHEVPPAQPATPTISQEGYGTPPPPPPSQELHLFSDSDMAIGASHGVKSLSRCEEQAAADQRDVVGYSDGRALRSDDLSARDAPPTAPRTPTCSEGGYGTPLPPPPQKVNLM